MASIPQVTTETARETLGAIDIAANSDIGGNHAFETSPTPPTIQCQNESTAAPRPTHPDATLALTAAESTPAGRSEINLDRIHISRSSLRP